MMGLIVTTSKVLAVAIMVLADTKESSDKVPTLAELLVATVTIIVELACRWQVQQRWIRVLMASCGHCLSFDRSFSHC